MASTAFIDHIDTLECDEAQGALVSLKQLVRVVNLVSTDYSVLYDALESAGIPKPGTALDIGKGSDLILARRPARIVDKDKGTVDVTLHWEHIHQGPNMDLQLRDFAKVKSSIVSIDTNHYTSYTNFLGQPTAPTQTLMTVAYTYPRNGPGGVFAGRTVVQTGKAKVFAPQSNYQFSGFLDVNQPAIVEGYMLKHLNSVVFRSRPPGTVICSEVQYHHHAFTSLDRPTKKRFFFHFEFQYKDDGWDPTVTFIDEVTSKPPPDLIPGIGYRTFGYYPRTDFRQILSGLQA